MPRKPTGERSIDGRIHKPFGHFGNEVYVDGSTEPLLGPDRDLDNKVGPGHLGTKTVFGGTVCASWNFNHTN